MPAMPPYIDTYYLEAACRTNKKRPVPQRDESAISRGATLLGSLRTTS